MTKKSRKNRIEQLLKIASDGFGSFGDPNMPERKKYLWTLMADMGLTPETFRKLPSDERKRFRAAARPQPIVEKKLKEMGYKMARRRRRDEPAVDTPLTERRYVTHILPGLTQSIKQAEDRINDALQRQREDIDAIKRELGMEV